MMSAMDRMKPCPLPFSRLTLNPNGEVAPCCNLAHYVIGDLRSESLADIWNGEKMRAMRRQHLEGNPVHCAEHIRLQACNEREPLSVRSWEESLPYPAPRLDVNLNGRCNLECIMCSVWKEPNGVFDESRFWTDGPSDIFPHLDALLVKGGEPFIQRDTYRLLDEVSRVNPRCRWSFVTNGQYRFNGAMRAALDKVHIDAVWLSLDSVDPETYARIRLKGRLEVALESLDAFIAYRDGLPPERRFKLAGAMAVQRENCREVTDFVSFCRAKGIEPSLMLVSYPLEHSILTLEAEAADSLARSYSEQAAALDCPDLRRLAGALPARS